jgi:hypothetical protein
MPRRMAASAQFMLQQDRSRPTHASSTTIFTPVRYAERYQSYQCMTTLSEYQEAVPGIVSAH